MYYVIILCILFMLCVTCYNDLNDTTYDDVDNTNMDRNDKFSKTTFQEENYLVQDPEYNTEQHGRMLHTEPDKSLNLPLNVKTSISTTEQIHFNDSLDSFYYSDTETEISQNTNIKITEQMDVNNSSEYYYTGTETIMSHTTERMYIDNYPEHKTETISNLFLDKNTSESPTDHSFLDARKRNNIYGYSKAVKTPRNRHIFFVKYHYGWRCKHLGHRRCKNVCVKFFKKICNEVTDCSSGSFTDKYTGLCTFRCNISFYKPDFNKKLFKRTKKTRRRHTTVPAARNLRTNYIKENKNEEDRLWNPMPRFRAETEENTDNDDDRKGGKEVVKWHKRKSRSRIEEDSDDFKFKPKIRVEGGETEESKQEYKEKDNEDGKQAYNEEDKENINEEDKEEYTAEDKYEDKIDK